MSKPGKFWQFEGYHEDIGEACIFEIVDADGKSFFIEQNFATGRSRIIRTEKQPNESPTGQSK